MISKIIPVQDSVEINTESFGQAKRGACVLISGAMAPARFWTDEFCESLASEEYLVIRYDHRDIGLSSAVDWEKSPYALSDLATDAIAILDEYEIEKAYFIGHSMGGHICQQLSLEYPEQVIGFTAISSGPIGATKDRDIPLSVEEKAILDKTWEILLSRKDSHDLQERINGFLKIWEYLNGCIAFDVSMARVYTIDLLTRTKHRIKAGNNHELVMRGLYESLPNLLQLIERIGVPTLIIHGDLDPLSLPRDAYALANAIPGAELSIMHGMGHMIFNRNLESEILFRIKKHINLAFDPRL